MRMGDDVGLRNQHLDEIIGDFVKLKEAIEPVIRQALDEAEQEVGDDD